MKTRIIGGDLVEGSRSEWSALYVTQRALQCDVSDTDQTTRRKYLGAGCSHHKQHNDRNLSQSYQLSRHQTKIWRDNDNLMMVDAVSGQALRTTLYQLSYPPHILW